ncbi:polysaccharide deacetylase [Alkalihalobacillus alcalophilus ATCC 27647 = CGMCC 1.3604]|uniref:Polysaccharide deacetylase n=2 Tax=Alkalihalobacillus alcalophilus TaxID=1445 RepID=A0A094WSK2_ALKAL|nr:polysaccharide deacetylase family protein [Alkalihalobacillus alcalophilus]KGA99058.1 polysaccharide deacetylase [Alkalihalobacillus alcalophilus ATCC 27647 = CGMCC 1.3604]MED1560703.1 polysaccharide deacetylase family protein [Alkalihalobacillus alcalophilus]THG88553.1 polysaccharide deacetylase [Alkalihalobacillus alcalophilus ATCC 27647 = CGMCC 1.3604]
MNTSKLQHFSILTSSFLMSLIMFTFQTSVLAQDSMLDEATVVIDNQPFETEYIMNEGHVLVPALFMKHTGALVNWNEQYESVVFQANEKKMALPVGKDYAEIYNEKKNQWERQPLPVKTIDYEGTAFIPLVAASRELGMDVTYHSQQARTYIQSNIQVTPNHFAQGNTSEKLVALTFDDGPDQHYTPIVLDILKEKGVHATFFVVGQQVMISPTIMQRIVDEGHGIGNHSWGHPNLKELWSSEVREEIQLTQETLQKTVGRAPMLFRPPYGSYTKAETVIFNELGIKNTLWSVDTLDWSGQGAEQILDTVHRQVFPGAIILQHNFQADEPLLDGSVEALPKMIDELREKGYKFVTLQTMIDRQR